VTTPTTERHYTLCTQRARRPPGLDFTAQLFEFFEKYFFSGLHFKASAWYSATGFSAWYSTTGRPYFRRGGV
jgi:hypothetical protein